MEGSHRAVTNSISTQLLRATTFPRTDGNLPGPGSIQFANVWPWAVQKAQIPRRAARGKSIWVHNVAQGCTHCTDDAPGVAVKAQVSASPLLTWLESLDASVLEAPVRRLPALPTGEQKRFGPRPVMRPKVAVSGIL